MQFPWRWNGDTISLNLDVIWGMSVELDGSKMSRINIRPGKKLSLWISYLLILLLAAITLLEVSLRILYREEAINGNYWGIGAFVQDADLGYRHAPGFRGYAYREKIGRASCRERV